MHELLTDALKEIETVVGGAKAVGGRLWPDLQPDAAGRRWRDCLNHDRAEKLSLDQLTLVMRLGAERGCHAPMQWLCNALNYDAPRPRDIAAERAALRQQMSALMARLGDLEDGQ